MPPTLLLVLQNSVYTAAVKLSLYERGDVPADGSLLADWRDVGIARDQPSRMETS